MALDSDRRICEFLASTLAMWEVDGRVEPLALPGVASIRLGADGARIVLERAPAGDPFRWYLRRSSANPTAGDERTGPARPCGSLVGVLSALRRMLGIERGATVRIARGT